ncbi:MAG: Biopolymer transport protein ExbD/TolR [Myxococcaceae bacterium]|jgi:biopolymer transport protein ExbD|nr:Biopolymer transport protein ExbD/TolR [Myxococcaceae bacterium]
MAGGAQSEGDESITAINVTPLVDITLVLLIIFMVTARLIDNQAVLLDLPKAASGAEVQVVFSIVLAADGSAQVDSRNVPNDDAILALAKETHQRNPDVRAVIKADSAVPHGRVIHVLDLLKQAQIAKIAFGVTPVSPMAPVPIPSPKP